MNSVEIENLTKSFRLVQWKGIRRRVTDISAVTDISFTVAEGESVAFIGEVASMILNDSVWLTFWWFFFLRFPVLRGWQVADVFTLWAISASGNLLVMRD